MWLLKSCFPSTTVKMKMASTTDEKVKTGTDEKIKITTDEAELTPKTKQKSVPKKLLPKVVCLGLG